MSENAVIHTDIEPAVITADMIKDAFRDQGPKGEAGRLMEEEGYDIHTTPCKKLRLEFLNILRIDHLWMLTGLTKLQLSNNIIEKIENLTELVNLVELDLSFNKIKVIENLDTLVNLEILTLFQNKIKVIENIDMLKNLEIFSIGNNLIEDLNCVLLLRNFTKLKALSMAGNPCANKGFRDHVAAFIPQLIYYEYKMISTVERENARNVQRAELEKLEAEEAKILKEKALVEATEKQLALHKEAYVEHLDKSQLFESLFENDSEGKAALLSGQEAEEIFEGFKTNVTDISHGLFNVGIEQLKVRQEEIRQFEIAVNRTKTQSIEASRELIEEFLGKKTKIFYSTKMLLDTVESTQQVDEKDLTDISERIRTNGELLQNETTKLWNTLMGNEITLFEQIEELNTSFERNLADLINVFVEQAQGFFTSVREKETTFMELISDHMLRFQTIVTVRNDDLTTYPPALRPMLADKDAVQAAMAASHDAHLLAIDGREDQLTSRIRDWHSNLCLTLQNNEVQRNRATVSEICHFLDFQREEFDELYSKLSDTYLSVGDENLIETQYMEDRHGGLSHSESSSVVTSEPPS